MTEKLSVWLKRKWEDSENLGGLYNDEVSDIIPKVEALEKRCDECREYGQKLCDGVNRKNDEITKLEAEAKKWKEFRDSLREHKCKYGSICAELQDTIQAWGKGAQKCMDEKDKLQEQIETTVKLHEQTIDYLVLPLQQKVSKAQALVEKWRNDDLAEEYQDQANHCADELEEVLGNE